MRILRLHIESFGGLQNFDLTLDEGLNSLHRQNGWGKSTLAVFIKAMLYGLPATTRRSLDDNERKKYTPWQGGAYGGSMEFETDRGTYRVERFFGAKESEDSFALYDLATNRPSTAFTASLGEELFGIDADGFERSTYLSQRALHGTKDNGTLAAKLGNLLDDVGDIGNYDTAMDALDKRRRHYVMTGNRGAIAEMEQELAERQREIERCTEKKKALLDLENERISCDHEIEATQKLIKENRARLETALLAREQNAHLEQKQKMQDELQEKKKRLSVTEQFFNGRIPTDEQLREKMRLHDEIKIAKAHLASLENAPQSAEQLTRLDAMFANGVPAKQDMTVAEEQNATLLRLCTKREILADRAAEEDAPYRRFANGAPSQPQLDSAFEALSHAELLQKEIHVLEKDMEQKQVFSSSLTPLSWLFFTLGIALAVLSLIPALIGFRLPLWIVAGVSLTVGIILSITVSVKRAAHRRIADGTAQKLEACREQQRKELRSVHALLANYRMPTDELSRSLTELTLLFSQFRDHRMQAEHARKELEALSAEQQKQAHTLHTFLARYIPLKAKKEDYRAEIDRLKADVAEYLRLSSARRQHQQALAEAQGTLGEKKQRLLPFLRLYDPNSRMKAGECLQAVKEKLDERARLLDEIKQKETELASFIAEKKLDSPDQAPSLDCDALKAEQQKLQEGYEELQRHRTGLKSAIDRLADDAARIPELEDAQEQLKLRIAEARANAATIANTAKLLEEAKTALSTRYLDGMQRSFHEYLSVLTEGKAPESTIDTSFEVRLREAGQTHSMESFSRGWRDAVEFCVRLSLTDALYAEGEQPFLLLDDPFVNLDEQHLTAAKRLLDQLSNRYQVIYLVCHQNRI